MFYFKIKYFTLRGPLPGLSPHFFFGNIIQSGILLNGSSLHKAYQSFKNRFGDIYQFWLGPWRLIVVNGLTDVQHIFTNRHIYDQGEMFVKQFKVLMHDGIVCLTGAKYKRHFSLIAPLFRRNRITPHFDLIVNCTDKLLEKWHSAPPNHIHLDVLEQCKNLLLAIFGLIAFDYNLETLDNNGNNELTQALKDFSSSVGSVIYLPKFLSILYLKLSPRQRHARAVIERYINRMIDHELAENTEMIAERRRTSLIASFVSALQKDEKLESSKSEEEKKGLSRNEVLHEMLFFMIAGSDTTASSLAWFIHLMSKHPRVQQKIKAELIDNSLEQDSFLERLDSLIYLDCVINEVFRFCPPGDSSARTLTTDDRLPGSGAQLYAGDQVLIPFFSLTRDTRYWSIDPEIFYPERFLNEDKNHHLYALLPFGGGHRQCVGQDLARFEMKIITARLMQYVTFVDGGSKVNAGGHLHGIIVGPKHLGVSIQFDK